MTEVPIAAARICQLPTVLANQIAAGEVVERPAAVVKELLENSIDAGASQVRIDVQRGGIDLIRVRDNGHGIDADDLALALARHATSKLHQVADLAAIATLGFRGEALPSIASVARLRLTSRTAQATHGLQVEIAGAATMEPPVPASHPVGTTVEVRDLFFNTPARRRFLRASRTEFLHVESVVRRTALAMPNVAIELWHGERRVLHAPSATAGEPRARIAALVGRQFADSAVYLSECTEAMTLRGWVMPMAMARAHSDIQYFCVNGRVVRDPMLRHALRMAHASMLADGRQPAYVLELLCPLDAVDVNVHPTKHELRFYESRHTHDFVVSTVSQALGIAGADAESTLIAEPNTDTYRDFVEPPPGTAGAPAAPGYTFSRADTHAALPHPLAGGRGGAKGGVDDQLHAPAKQYPPGAWVLKLAPGFALTRAGNMHCVVHLGRLAEHCVGVALRATTSASSPVPAYPLLLPHAWSLRERDANTLEQRLSQCQALGFELRRSAPAQFMLLTIPRVLRGVAAATIVTTLDEWLDDGAQAGRLVTQLSRMAANLADDISQDSVDAWLRSCEAAADDGVWRVFDGTELTRWFRG